MVDGAARRERCGRYHHCGRLETIIALNQFVFNNEEIVETDNLGSANAGTTVYNGAVPSGGAQSARRTRGLTPVSRQTQCLP